MLPVMGIVGAWVGITCSEKVGIDNESLLTVKLYLVVTIAAPPRHMLGN